ncbi:FtsW/RodA/SpoVE family cell cycle protein [Paenibacillus sp. GSMTC-2017]|uniref:FtsW/RodA/SpoVE family cell cycle protein n=1 Tax=Paenibacillus sp. GSMTC-2017 TaxID=2794350 RepID=UPI0018D728CD|nr:FtsW/RodA/SpoVE family cell cycle protein [Paenibacillus sp. GSMTC-2017]MBH5320503.1 FtsW/RodA/SpoVE family cell cycle protein [Paenibacillus sp. GSMTC-2017]
MSEGLKGFGKHPLIVQYLERVCGQVKAKDVHEDIRLELMAHLEELAEERSDQEDKSLDEIVNDVLKQMGDPKQVGIGFHAVHKPKPEWSVIALIVGMVCIAVVSIFALHEAYSDVFSITNKLFCGLIGTAVMIALYFADYRKLLRYSWLLYCATLLLLVLTKVGGLHVNGKQQWIDLGPFNLNIYAASPYLFLISIAGILHLQRKKDLKSKLFLLVRFVGNITTFMMLPAFFYLSASALSYFGVFCIGLVALLIMDGRKKLLLYSVALASSFVAVLFHQDPWRKEFIWIRLLGFAQKKTDASYWTERSVEAIQSGGMWGQGLGAVNNRLPIPFGEMQFSYLVYSLGWVFGVVLILFSLVFVIRLARMGRLLKDGYARGIITALTTVLGIQLIWNLLMCLGLLPIMGLNLPIMNWSSQTVFELAAIGLMLSAYRRKDMISQSQLPKAIA